MKPFLKAAMAGLLTAAIAGGGLLGLATASFAAGSAPTWEPDTNAATPYGNVTFYDAAGNQVTSGTGDLSSPFAYVVAGTAADSGATKASLSFANPTHGVVPGLWGNWSAAGPTTFSPSLSGAPADIAAFAPTDAVVASTAASITNWLGANVPDTTAGYANTIQVRLTDSGPSGHGNATGTYWESDIGYNNTSSPITVDGTTVPANGWAVLYPIVNNGTITTLTTPANGANVTANTPVTLTATETPVVAGSVQFYANGTTLVGTSTTPGSGTYTATWTPTVTGTDSITATFLPSAGGPGSIGDGVTITVNPPNIGGTPTLSASPTSITAGSPDTLTATVTYADNSLTGVAGTVKFMIGATLITGCTNPVATTVTGLGTTASPGVGTAICTTSSLPVGSDSIIMTFSPPSGYTPLFAGSVTVTVAPPPNFCSYASATNLPPNGTAPYLTTPCQEQQGIQVVINPGTITVTTPYTASNPFTLTSPTLSSDGTYLSSRTQFPKSTDAPITVTSQLSPAYAWTLSVAATQLTLNAGNVIPASGLGLVGGTLLNPPPGATSYPGTMTFTDIPSHNPSAADPDTNSGLTNIPQTFAHSSAADGTAEMDGTLTLLASTSLAAGTYTGTITFSVS
ncbi:MAG: Ig-like domain repeat protein [Acidimicrobiales bacterium]